jgi:hypothetical protein
MSLTTFLENEDVKKKFREEFKKPRFSYSKMISVKPKTMNFGMVGTAFDYLIRFHIEEINKNKTKSGEWIAEEVVKSGFLRGDQKKAAERIVTEARENQKKFLENGKLTLELTTSLLQLAQLDVIKRMGRIEQQLGKVDFRDIEDLVELFGSLDIKSWFAKDVCFLNPTFGKASLMVKGADADIVIDNLLIDVKTTTALGMSRKTFDQLIGYYILYSLDGIQGATDESIIKKLGCYSSRYGELISFDVVDVIDMNRLGDIQDWFVKKARDIFNWNI